MAKKQTYQRYVPPPTSAVQFQVSIKMDMNELARLRPEQIEAVLQGVAKVIAVQHAAG